MKTSKLNFLSIVGFLSIILIIVLSMPYPWCGFSSWLETFFTKVENCGCICPWWLFVFGQIISAYFLFLLAQSVKKHSKAKYVILQFVIGIVFWVLHNLLHNYYIEREAFDPSVVCNWMWLISLVVAIIFSLLPIYREKSKKP